MATFRKRNDKWQARVQRSGQDSIGTGGQNSIGANNLTLNARPDKHFRCL